MTATFVFTDLVDSTATASRLGPEAAEDLRQAHFRLLRGAVAASGGTEVKNLGDGLMVMFSSTTRAIVGAVAMQTAIERHNRRAVERLPVRIGMSVGEVTEEDGDYFGEPVVEAARLCAAATGGQILATRLVEVMAGRHSAQKFESVGVLELKGLPDPVDSVSISWNATAPEGAVPLPRPLVGVATDALFGFFGRAQEIELLNDAYKRSVSDCRVQVALLSGEAGIGKTSLVAQFARGVHESGAVVLFGHCDEELGVSYQPWIEAVHELGEGPAAALIETLPTGQRAVLGRLVAGFGAEDSSTGVSTSDSSTSDSERLILFNAVREALAVASAVTPIVLVLDDVHWIDVASLHLLRHVVRSSPEAPLLILATYRHTDIGPSHALTGFLADMHRESNISRLQLRGLADTELLELMVAAAGHALDENGVGLANALHRETDGNPFFAGELLRHLWESGTMYINADGHWALTTDVAELGLPGSVRDVVARRIARLGEDARRALSVAAVIGRDFDVDLLAAATGTSEDAILDVLDAAAGAAIVSEVIDTPGRYRFAHALMQHTLYDELSAARRQRTHLRIAQALEDTPGDEADRVPELARHWLAATKPAEIDKALRYVELAARAAVRSLAFDEAVEWYRQALELNGDGVTADERTRCRLLVGMGQAQRLAGGAEHRDTLIHAARIARRLDDGELLVASVLACARGAGMTADTNTDLVELATAALESATSRSDAEHGLLLAALSELDWENRAEWAEKAIAVARELPDDATWLRIMNSTHQTRGPDSLIERLVETERAIAIADRGNDALQSFTTRLIRILPCVEAADIDEVDERLAEMSELADQSGLAEQRWHVERCRSWRALVAGDVAMAESTAESALAAGLESGQPEAMGTFGGQLFEIRHTQGRLSEIVELFAGALRENPAITVLQAALLMMYCELGRLDEARPIFAEHASTDFAAFPFDFTWTSSMAMLAEGALALEDRAAAQRLYEKLIPYRTHVIYNNGTVLGSVGRLAGRLGLFLGRDESIELLRQALIVHERLRSPYWIATTQLDLADAFASGDVTARATARALAGDARSTARERGFVTLELRAAALMGG